MYKKYKLIFSSYYLNMVDKKKRQDKSTQWSGQCGKGGMTKIK